MKKFITGFAGFLLIVSLFIFLSIVTITKFFQADNLSKSIKNIYHSQENYTDNYFNLMINGSNSKERYQKFFDNEKLEDLYIKYFTEYIIYANGIPNTEKPEFDELKKYVDDVNLKYEEETGYAPDTESSFKFFYDLDINTSKKAKISDKIKSVIEFVYKYHLQDIALAFVVGCTIVVIMMNREIKRILLQLSSVFLSNGVGMLILKKIIDNHISSITQDWFLLGLVKELSSKYTPICIISFVIGFIALLAFILIKIFYRRSKPQLLEQTTEAIPEYMKDQIYQQDSLNQFNNMGKQ